MDSLKANVILRNALNYDFHKDDIIDVKDGEEVDYEVAGLIDQDNKLVLISRNYSKETQNFTMAHELGHAIMHKQSVLHRDRPLDGSKLYKRNIQEIQADKFASYFLMPRKLVTEVYEELFLTKSFEINELTTYRLTRDSRTDKLVEELKNLRGLSRRLASATSYDSKQFNSLAQIFGVSVEAMAIRLEELGLVKF